MAFTYSKIAEYEVPSGGVSAISFANIPQNYTDLIVKLSLRGTYANTGLGLFMSINGTTTGYSWRQIYGTGSATGSNSGTDTTAGNITGANATANTFSNIEFYIPNYTSANNKSFSRDGVDENNSSTAVSQLGANLWSNATAISSLRFTPEASNFAQYSTVTIYGIRATEY